MQLLYSLDRDPGVSQKEILQRYDHSVEMAYESLMFNLFILLEIAHQAVVDRMHDLAGAHRCQPGHGKQEQEIPRSESVGPAEREA